MSRPSKTGRQRARLTMTSLSFLAFPVTIFYFSPYLSVMGAFDGIVAGCLMAFGVQLLSSVFLRRAWCGWLCPAGGLQDLESKFADRPDGASRKLDPVKYVIWVPWIASIVAGFVVAGGVTAVDPLYQTYHGISVSDPHSLLIYLCIVLLFFVPNLFLGRRAMCHCICWMAPFMVLGSKLGNLLHAPQLHVSAKSDACIQCGMCTRACPMSLPVQEMVRDGGVGHSECIQCGACCDACRSNVLRLGFRASK